MQLVQKRGIPTISHWGLFLHVVCSTFTFLAGDFRASNTWVLGNEIEEDCLQLKTGF